MPGQGTPVTTVGAGGLPVTPVDAQGRPIVPGFVPNLATTGKLIFGDSASVIVPGATSFAVRDHADAVNNFTVIDNTLHTGGAVGIGGAPNANSPLTLTQSGLGGTGALVINSDARSMSIINSTDWSDLSNGTFSDTIDITHKSAGDAIFIAMIGGLKPGGNTTTGADAALNVLIPAYRDALGDGRTGGTVINNFTAMTGLLIDYQPIVAGTGFALKYAGPDQAFHLISQPTGTPVGNGLAMWASHYGTNTMFKIDHHEGTTNQTFKLNRFDDATGASQWLGLQLNGESAARFVMNYAGMMTWGDGTVQDAVLYRFSAKTIALKNALYLIQAAGQSGSVILSAITSGDGNYGFTLLANGLMNWGDRTASLDTNLYRGAAGQLKTDNSLRVVGDSIKNGTGTAMVVGFGFVAGWTGAPTGVPTNYAAGNGLPMYFDTTNNFLYIYTGGAWKKSTVYA